MKPHRELGTGFVVGVAQKDWRTAQKDQRQMSGEQWQRVTKGSIPMLRGRDL